MVLFLFICKVKFSLFARAERWKKHTSFTFLFWWHFKSLHQICLTVGCNQRAQGSLYLFPQPCCLASCLSGSSTPAGQTDDDDDSHQGCSSLPPVHPTGGARGAGAENGEQREGSEWRYWQRERERLVGDNEGTPVSTCYQGLPGYVGLQRGLKDTANPSVNVLSDILINQTKSVNLMVALQGTSRDHQRKENSSSYDWETMGKMSPGRNAITIFTLL